MMCLWTLGCQKRPGTGVTVRETAAHEPDEQAGKNAPEAEMRRLCRKKLDAEKYRLKSFMNIHEKPNDRIIGMLAEKSIMGDISIENDWM